MSLIYSTVLIVAGFILGILVAFMLGIIQKNIRQKEIDTMISSVESNFENLSYKALKGATEELLKLAKEQSESERRLSTQELDSKKGLIDQQIKNMNDLMEKVRSDIGTFEKDREQKFGEINSTIKIAVESTYKLLDATNLLNRTLTSTKSRGQWGERMAEDIINMVGLIKGKNYLQQNVGNESGTRPDFTFILPKNLKLNMDVKFPLNNYIKYIDAQSETEKNHHQGEFLKDVKQRIKEVTTKEYINPLDNTLDYVLLFIPNEGIYSFIHECDSSIVDQAIKTKVVLCSPLSLFSFLVVVRQAVDSFVLEKKSNEVISQFGAFFKQWNLFKKDFEALGKSIESVQRKFNQLYSTRTNQLEKPLNKIESFREELGLEVDSEITSQDLNNEILLTEDTNENES